MLTDEQKAELIQASVRVMRGEDADCEGLFALVESFLDPLRARDPKVELPEDGQEVIFQCHEGRRDLGWFFKASDIAAYFWDGIDGWSTQQVLAWWPAPKLWGRGVLTPPGRPGSALEPAAPASTTKGGGL